MGWNHQPVNETNFHGYYTTSQVSLSGTGFGKLGLVLGSDQRSFFCSFYHAEMMWGVTLWCINYKWSFSIAMLIYQRVGDLERFRNVAGWLTASALADEMDDMVLSSVWKLTRACIRKGPSAFACTCVTTLLQGHVSVQQFVQSGTSANLLANVRGHPQSH